MRDLRDGLPHRRQCFRSSQAAFRFSSFRYVNKRHNLSLLAINLERRRVNVKTLIGTVWRVLVTDPASAILRALYARGGRGLQHLHSIGRREFIMNRVADFGFGEDLEESSVGAAYAVMRVNGCDSRAHAFEHL